MAARSKPVMLGSSIKLDEDGRILELWENLLSGSDTDFVVMQFAQDGNSKTNMELAESGSSGYGGIQKFCTQTEDRVYFALLRITTVDEGTERHKFVFLSYIGPSVRIMKKARSGFQTEQAMQYFDKAMYFEQTDDWNYVEICQKIHKASGASNMSMMDLGFPADSVKPIQTKIKISLFIGILAQLCSGTLGAFSSYSEGIKQTLRLSQTEIETIGAAGNIGQYAGPFAALLFDLLGTRISCMIAGSLLLLGYLLISLTLGGVISMSAAASGIAGFQFFAGFGSGMLYLTCLSCNIQAMPVRYRGMVIGAVVSTYAVSGAVFSGLYQVLFHSSNISAQYLFMAVTCCAASFIAAFMMVPSIRQRSTLENLPSGAPVSHSAESGSDCYIDTVSTVTAGRPQELLKTLTTLIQSKMFWAFWLINFCIEGGCYLQINNIGTIIVSLNEGSNDPTFVLLCITLFSVANGMARIAAGISDHLDLRRGWFIVLAAFIMAMFQLSNAVLVADKYGVLVASIGVGIAHGVNNCALATVVSEHWGTQDFGQYYGWILTSPAAASYGVNAISGVIYDNRLVPITPGLPIPTAPDGTLLDHSCLGKHCFTAAYYITVGMALVALVMALYITPRSSPGRKKVLNLADLGRSTGDETRERGIAGAYHKLGGEYEAKNTKKVSISTELTVTSNPAVPPVSM